MKIRSQTELAFDHSLYIVAAHLVLPLFEQISFFRLAKHFGFKRQILIRLLGSQAVGSVVYVNRDSCALAIIICGAVSGDLRFRNLKSVLQQIVPQTDERTAVLAEGFLVAHAKKSPQAYGYELLLKILNRLDFKGTVYAPPARQVSTAEPLIFQDELATDTRMLLTHDGRVRPSIIPGMFLAAKKSKSK